MKRRVPLLLLTCVAPSIALSAYTTAGPAETQRLKSYAVSQCIARGFPGPAVREDAVASAAGYLAFGHAPAKEYEKADVLAHKASQRDPQSRYGSELHVLRCIDLMFDAQVGALGQTASAIF